MARKRTVQIPSDDELKRLYPRLLLAAYWRLAYLDLLHEVDAEDIVQDSFESLLVGKCPPDVDVSAFLFNRVRQAAFNRARSRQGRLERLAESDDVFDVASAEPSPDVLVDDLTLSRAVRARLAALAADDDEVCRLVDAYASGLKTRGEICAELGISADQLRQARRRLNRRVAQLPKELVAAVVDHLGRAS